MINDVTKKIVGYLSLLDHHTDDRSDNGNAYLRKRNIDGIISRGCDVKELETTLEWLIQNEILFDVGNASIADNQYVLELIDLKKARDMLKL